MLKLHNMHIDSISSNFLIEFDGAAEVDDLG